MTPFVYLNGKIVKLKDAKISVRDSGFMSGFGVYEVWLFRHGKFHLFRENFAQLQNGIDQLALPFKLNQTKFKAVVKQLLQKNHLENARVRATVTLENTLIETTLLIGAKSKLRAFTVQSERPVPILKSISRVASLLALFEAKAKGADEAILVDKNDEVMQGSKSNLFIVKNKKIFTPSKDLVHPGAVRTLIFHLAKKLKVPIKERVITLEELYRADEVFLTSSLGGIQAVTHVDGAAIRSGEVGVTTLRIREAFQSTLP